MNSKKVFFKIIVPNYNNMPYIKKCLDSILQQTFKDFFVVVVDDMSTDCSDKFCEAYERIYPDKMTLLRLEKKGYAGAARNRGLEWNGVESEYIWFVDSDDWLYDNNVLQKMHDKIVEVQMPDLLRVDAQIWNGRTSRLMKGESRLESIAKSGKCAPWWNCIRSKFAGIKFEEDRAKCNDVLWFARLLDKLDPNSVIKTDWPCYVYNTASATSCWNSSSAAKAACIDAYEKNKIDLEEFQPKTKFSHVFIETQLKDYANKGYTVKHHKAYSKAQVKMCQTGSIKINDNKSNNCFFKIIVPNYNNMPYIKKCLDSILNQTFQDFKIAVVDDMSTDCSDKFCEAYERTYPDKIVYKQVDKHGEAGKCRNIALQLDNIQSEYTWFVDSDDWLYSNDVLQKLHDLIVRKGMPDLVRCQLYHWFGDDNPMNRHEKESASIETIVKMGAGPARNCVKSTMKALFKEDRAQWNDVTWFLEMLDQIDQSSIVAADFDCYTYNRASQTSSSNSERYLDKDCIDAQYMLNADLEHLELNTEICKRYRKKMQDMCKNLYNSITVDEFTSNAYVISIDDSKLQLFQKTMTASGLKHLPKLFNGIVDKHKKAVENCRDSHLAIVKMAKKLDLPFVVVFEDDAYPCIDICHKLERYLRAIPYDAHLVLLGYSAYRRDQQHMPQPIYNKITTTTVCGAHSYILFRHGYDQYIEFFNKNPNKTADTDVFFAVKPSYVVKNPLFIQYNKSSSIVNKHSGYILFGDNLEPPVGFYAIETLFKE